MQYKQQSLLQQFRCPQHRLQWDHRLLIGNECGTRTVRVLFKDGVYSVQCKRANGCGNNLRAGSIRGNTVVVISAQLRDEVIATPERRLTFHDEDSTCYLWSIILHHSQDLAAQEMGKDQILLDMS